MDLAIIDFSWYENPFDPVSNALLLKALEKRGMAAEIIPFPRSGNRKISAARAWLRYDLREQSDLTRVAECAQRFKRNGLQIFPSPEAIVAAEDKWVTAQVLKKAGVAIPRTVLGESISDESCSIQILEKAGVAIPRALLGEEAPVRNRPKFSSLIYKTRVGWGGHGTWVFPWPPPYAVYNYEIDDWVDPETGKVIQWPGEMIPPDTADYVVQRFIPHERTLIAALAADCPITCIEDVGGGLRADGRVGTIPFPPGAIELAARALAAVDLVTGTVDLIEAPGGLLVLEVNSAPRLTYPHMPEVDLAGPMVDAVVAWMNRR